MKERLYERIMLGVKLSSIEFHSDNEMFACRVKIPFDTRRLEGTYNHECVDITTP